ncbi:MAG: dTDP-glucose 4,6-dehydratase [Treponema sp.]|jgi:dTDP-glucose 4,6-dehydratase|nr:dTDP-glucose 4,6-dehydratase [Treponema sp.]
MRNLKNILVTGGCGFIGVNFIRLLFKHTPEFSGRIINLDALTYAGNITSLQEIEKEFGIDSGSTVRYFFELGDICDRQRLEGIFDKYDIDTVVNFAAESHVDRSILGPETFVKTNVMGTFALLDVARRHWQLDAEDSSGPLPVSADAEYIPGVIFHHVSTDEVYGSLGEAGFFTETTPYDPRSPYSASKAASDHLVMAWHHTYGLPVTLSNCSNNFGPFQFPEKLIPLMIINMMEGKPLPVYGDGKNIRDWLYVEDHGRALWAILSKGQLGEKYNVGGENEMENVAIIDELIKIVADKSGMDPEKIRRTIRFVKDRPGHDRRYAIDCSRIKEELGWERETSFEEGLIKTVEWYRDNMTWINRIRSGEYRYWVEENYGRR